MAPAALRHTAQPLASRREVVERVEAFVRARLGESVSIPVLCQIAGVSERSLRNAFYDVRGMSPKRSAVRLRLAEVRRALSGAHGARGSVTTIATDHGFFELGRFASTYKAVFGESPSATLRCGGTGAAAA
jgi:transcriptional regulator GlxA family with amidase domain